jgi:hypothetical protein
MRSRAPHATGHAHRPDCSARSAELRSALRSR